MKTKVENQARAITLADLQCGARARINEVECEQLTGRKRSSLQRDRWKGRGMPFQKDENGRVWYSAEDVLAYVHGPKHKSTSEYDTSSNLERLEVARSVKQAKAGISTEESSPCANQ